MRAYWAVIKDAFRAAIAAKLLYVMLILIVLFLLVLAPLSYKETLSYTLREMDVRNVSAIAERLYSASQAEQLNADKYLWDQLSERSQKLVTEFVKPEADSDAPGEQFNRINQMDFLRQSLHRDLKEVIDDPDFYDPDALADVELDEEAQALAKKASGSRTEDQTKRLNRLVLDGVFPLELAKSSSTMLRFTYLGFVPPLEDFALSRRELDLLSTTTIPWILDKLVLSIGVLIAILFTANMVPELLEPGSLNLLLSKPVRRWGLFLSKYLGACVFSLLNATLLFAGLWLILGSRLGIWNVAFLMCIPIYVFVFAIYYSVSAFIGLIFRSAILSVVSAILFWLFCFTIGLTHFWISNSLEGSEPAQLVVDGGKFVKFDRANRAAVMGAEQGEWVTAFQSQDMDALPAFMKGLMPGSPMLGLTYDTEGERFVGAQVPFGEVGSPFSTNRFIVTARDDDGWVTSTKMKAPAFTRAIFQDRDGSLILVTFFGKILRLPLDKIDEYQATNVLEQPNETDLAAEPIDDADYFTDISPEFPVPSEQIELIGWDPKSQSLAFFGNGKLTLLNWNGTQYEWGDNDRYGLPTDTPGSAIALGGGQAFVGVKNESLFVIDLTSGEVTQLPWPSDAQINTILADPNGARVVILDAAGFLWQLPAGAEVVTRLSARGQGKIRAITYGTEDRFWTIDAYARVHAYGWSDGRHLESGASSMGMFQAVYEYGIHPLYWVSPKPGEFYRVVIHLADLVGSDEEEKEDEPVDVVQREVAQNSQVRSQRSPWLPVWNGLAFIGVMLGLSIWYFERQDF